MKGEKKMKRFIVLSIVLLMLAGFAITSSAAVADETQSKLPLEEVISATAVMPLNGSWVILDQIMTAPAFFNGNAPWTWDSDLPVEFTITDYYVVTDRFKVYDWGSFVIETPNVSDWYVYATTPHFDPPWAGDPDTALAYGVCSSAVIYFASGSHSIDIENIHIPPISWPGGPPFSDGTVAFKAERLREWPIDIKPGSDPNSINTKSKGVIPVAILGSAIFDVTTVDVTTLEFGPDGATPAHDLTDPVVYADHLQDVNLDGFTDLVCHFKTQEAGLVMGDTDATLTGDTNDGETFTGMDSVNIVK